MDAVPDLVRIVQLAKTIFGEDTEISLRRDRDPDGDSEYLVVGIRTVLEPAQAHNLLSRLREEWWAIAPSDIEDQILVANEFL